MDTYKKWLRKFRPTKLENMKEFIEFNNHLLLKRIRLVSVGTLIVNLCFILINIFATKEVNHPLYRYNFITIHLFSAIVTTIYLLFYRKMIGKRALITTRGTTMIINAYVFIFAFMGVAFSLNNQMIGSNTSPYLTIILGIVALFHIRPPHLFFTLLINHGIFYFGLLALTPAGENIAIEHNLAIFTIFIAFVIGTAFYSYQIRAFSSRKKLKNREENFRKLFDINPFPLVLTSLVDGRVMEVNKQAQEFYGVSLD